LTRRNLRERQAERLRLAAEVTADIMFEWDLRTNRVANFGRPNPEFHYFQGASLDAWMSQFDEHEGAELLAAIARAIHTRHPLKREHRILGRDGRWRYVLTRGRVICDATGRRVRWVGSSTDITDQRMAAFEAFAPAIPQEPAGEPYRAQ
jgi:PAS domain S-box-containing protein